MELEMETEGRLKKWVTEIETDRHSLGSTSQGYTHVLGVWPSVVVPKRRRKEHFGRSRPVRRQLLIYDIMMLC